MGNLVPNNCKASGTHQARKRALRLPSIVGLYPGRLFFDWSVHDVQLKPTFFLTLPYFTDRSTLCNLSSKFFASQVHLVNLMAAVNMLIEVFTTGQHCRLWPLLNSFDRRLLNHALPGFSLQGTLWLSPAIPCIGGLRIPRPFEIRYAWGCLRRLADCYLLQFALGHSCLNTNLRFALQSDSSSGALGKSTFGYGRCGGRAWLAAGWYRLAVGIGGLVCRAAVLGDLQYNTTWEQSCPIDG